MKHPKPNFYADTREARRAAKLRRLLCHAILFALLVAGSLFALGWALSVAPTMKPITVAEAAQ